MMDVELKTLTARLAGPNGLGTSAARLLGMYSPVAAPPAAAVDAVEPVEPSAALVVDDPAYAYRPWGDGTASPVYCPLTERIDDRLAAEVDARLLVWATTCGFDEESLSAIRKATFGRLVMLTHPDTDDADRLLVAAQLNAAWWAADDSYADDSDRGAVPEQLPARLMLVMAAMDPLPRAGEFTPPLEAALHDDPILVALRSGVEHLAQYGGPAVVQRVCYSTFAMFVSWTAYAAWRHTGEYPPAWKYLAARQHDSFYTSMTLIDALGGYELTANVFYERRVRHAAFLAGTASVLINDLHSVAKDAADEKPVCNMVLLIAADKKCSIQEATEQVVALHNDVVRDFQSIHREVLAVPSVELQRFMRGLRAWMGGGFEWHSTNPRYKSGAKQS